MNGGGASAAAEDVKRKQKDNRLGQIVAFAGLGAACCDGRFAAAISMDIKNLVIPISHEAEGLVRGCVSGQRQGMRSADNLEQRPLTNEA